MIVDDSSYTFAPALYDFCLGSRILLIYPPQKKVPSPVLALCRSQVRDIYTINLVYRVQRGRLQPRYLAAVADGEGVFLAVFALHAAVFEFDVDGAVERAAHGKRSCGEDGVVILAGGAVRIDELSAVGLIVLYHPIAFEALPLSPFGQVYGAAAHVQVFVQFKPHPFFTVGREVKIESVVAVELVFVFGLDDGFLHAVDGYGVGEFWLGLVVIVFRARGKRGAHHHRCCKSESCFRCACKKLFCSHKFLCPPDDPRDLCLCENAVSGAVGVWGYEMFLLFHHFFTIDNVHALGQIFQLTRQAHTAEGIDAALFLRHVGFHALDAGSILGDHHPVSYYLIVCAEEGVGYIGIVLFPVCSRGTCDCAAGELGGILHIAEASGTAALGADVTVVELPMAFRESVRSSDDFQGAIAHGNCAIVDKAETVVFIACRR